MMQSAATPRAHRARPLAELAAGVVAVPDSVVVTDVTLDSREARPGSLFLACRGLTRHGLEFAPEALARGARAVLYEEDGRPLPPLPPAGEGAFVAAVPRLGRHVGQIADRFFDAPSQALAVLGVTGTNGKTTCAYLLAQALSASGRPAAYAGTLGYGRPGVLRPTAHTTADAVRVHRQLAELRDLGAECVAMEVSSHALEQSRVDGVRFRLAAFTNLTHDHLDYHGSMEAYGAAKARLFERETLGARIVNVDDPFGAQLAARPGAGRLVVTTRAAADRVPSGADYVRAARVQISPGGLAIAVESSWGAVGLDVPLIGDFNVDNALTVLAALLALDVPPAQAAAALARCAAPPGRMETFGGRAGRPLVIVDYAHTPDALAKALRAARAHCAGRLHVVFGCGGDRDRAKRPAMGRIAAQLADEIVVTDDNPRSEDPRAIAADILAGIAARGAVRVEHDRAAAIRAAVAAAGEGDVVLVAGKGHEDYQIQGGERRPFSDQAVVRAALGERP